MSYSARIVRDSLHPDSAGPRRRLTTFEVTFPRIVLAEFNTHRVFSRNSASSRAIPTERLLKSVEEDPFIPEEWGSNQAGMQAGEPLGAVESEGCRRLWLQARDQAVTYAKHLHAMGAHKQLANRLLEPFMWTTVIVTSSTYANFFKLRCHEAAQPQIRKVAEMMRDLYEASSPTVLRRDQWHLPYVTADEERELLAVDALKVSAARCARVSYTKHNEKKDLDDDLALHDRLAESGHWSPFEHQAVPAYSGYHVGGNFGSDWKQYRKTFHHESGET